MGAAAQAGRPTVLVLASTYPRWSGDAEPGFVHELARRLTSFFRVIVLAPHAPGAKEHEVLHGVEIVRYRYAPGRLESLVNHGGIITNLRHSRWKWLLVPSFVVAQALRAWEICRREPVHVVHAHWLLPQGLNAWLLRRLPGSKPPFVVTSHGADLFALQGWIAKRMKRLVMRDAAAVTVVSKRMREVAQEIAGPDLEVNVQSMGVDLARKFFPDPGVVRSANEILFVGRLVEKKGLWHLLNALPMVIGDRPGVVLNIVGFGPEERSLKDQVARLELGGHVHFLGAVSQAELPDHYRRAAVFVAPFVEAKSGDQEGLGLVLLEAIGCGCPVIAGNVRAVRDILGDKADQVVEAEDAAALARTILDVLSQPARYRAEAAELSEKLAARFDWRAVGARYAATLVEAAGHPGKHAETNRK